MPSRWRFTGIALCVLAVAGLCVLAAALNSNWEYEANILWYQSINRWQRR